MKIKLDYYYDFEELDAVLRSASASLPDVCRMETIGTTREGRPVRLLTVTDFSTGPSGDKPGYYIEACTHSEEYCGTNMALGVLKTLLEGAAAQDAGILQILKDVAFYIVPRVNPDGVETVMKTGLIGVSNGKYSFEEKQPWPGLYQTDLDGNGVVAQMRVPDPDGEWKISERDPRLMSLRKPDETGGQYYRLYPEGLIRGDEDGFAIPLPNDVNLNRNYPIHWQPEGLQYGACELPLSEPETRAVAEFILAHPNIAMVMAYHTNAGAIMRPFGSMNDSNFKGNDLKLYKVLGAIGTEETGYQVMSTFGDFTPPGSRIRGGSLTDFTFDGLGIPSFTLELWNIYDAAGVERPKEFHFASKDEEKEEALLAWSDRELGEKGYLPWKEFDHPQLGKVEIGGWDWIRTERNPPEHFLPGMAEKVGAFTLRLAKTLPHLAIRKMEAHRLAEDYYEVSAVVRNSGFLPTYLTAQAKAMKTDGAVGFSLTAADGTLEVVLCDAKEDLGHLEGRFGRDAEWSRDRAMWDPSERSVHWVVKTDAKELVLTAFSPKCGKCSGFLQLT